MKRGEEQGNFTPRKGLAKKWEPCSAKKGKTRRRTVWFKTPRKGGREEDGRKGAKNENKEGEGRWKNKKHSEPGESRRRFITKVTAVFRALLERLTTGAETGKVKERE